MIQKKWAEVPAQLFTTNGDSEGNFRVSDASLFKVQQRVTLFSDFKPPIELEVKRISSPIDIKVGLIGQPIHSGFNISDFLVSDNSKISAREQERPAIPPDAFNRAVFEEEPTVAIRSTLVDKHGRKLDTDDQDGISLLTKTTVRNAVITVPYDQVTVTAKNSDGNPENIEYRSLGQLVATMSISYDLDGDFEEYEVTYE